MRKTMATTPMTTLTTKPTKHQRGAAHLQAHCLDPFLKNGKRLPPLWFCSSWLTNPIVSLCNAFRSNRCTRHVLDDRDQRCPHSARCALHTTLLNNSVNFTCFVRMMNEAWTTCYASLACVCTARSRMDGDSHFGHDSHTVIIIYSDITPTIIQEDHSSPADTLVACFPIIPLLLAS